jgi:hypothetical protein
LAGALPAAADALGLDLDGLDLAGVRPPGRAGPATPARGVVLVLVDGLGLENLRQRRGHAPFLWGAGPEEWVTCFPSTTVAALGSFGTGLSPGLTALAGYSLRDPANGRRASLIKWDAATPPEVWQPHQTLFQRFAAQGSAAAFVGEARFEDSAMTRSSLRGARFVDGGARPETRVEAALRVARGGEGLVYLYWGDLDKRGHALGFQSAEWAEALAELDSAMARLAGALPAGWELWLTADHGMVDADPAASWEVADHKGLAEGVDLVAGEARAPQLYTAQPERVAARWREVLGDQAWVLTRDDAVAANLFGPTNSRALPYLGDVVVAMAGRATVLDTVSQGPGPARMVGHHGSLTAQEMAIPFIRV